MQVMNKKKILVILMKQNLNRKIARLLRRLPTVQPIFEHLGNTSALINMSYFFQLDMKI